MKESSVIYIIGCGVLGPEIRYLAGELSIEHQLKFLPGGLHDTPDLLRTNLQDAIDEASRDPRCERIIIGYGLCGRGTVGIKANRVPLVFPRVHDCIALFLGGDRRYKEQFHKYPGTYYITEGWRLDKGGADRKKGKTVWVGSQALGCHELEERYGEKSGKAIAEFFGSWTANYQRAAYIHTGIGNRKRTERYAREMAEDHGWKFETLKGDLSLLKKLVQNRISDQDVLVVPPGYRTIHSSAENNIAAAPKIETGENLDFGPRYLSFDGSAPSPEHTPAVEMGLGIDAGGTYTDGVIYDFKKQKVVDKHKSLTTQWDFAQGIDNCLKGLDKRHLKKIDLVSVSTTLATNAIVEGEGQKVGLILMAGKGQMDDDPLNHRPKRYIKGRMNIGGRVTEPVDGNEVRQLARHMCASDGVTAFAVSGYGGSVNPVHEQLVRDLIRQETGMVVCCGHELSDQLNLMTRAQTAVVNAQIIPRMLRFFRDLDRVLERWRLSVPVMVVKGDGTFITKAMALEKPVETILSGPAASVAGARHLTGLTDAMVVDIGGTTTDSADIANGRVGVSKEGAIVGGIKTHVRALDMKTVGLGGDSHLFWNDGKFEVRARRVAPLVWANDVAQGVREAIDSMAVRPLHYQKQMILVAMAAGTDVTLNGEEQAIYAALRERPHTFEQLAAHLNLLSPQLLSLGRLEECGLVQRCGLTPTDLLHAEGSFRRWSPNPAHQMIGMLSHKLQTPADILTKKLLDQVTSKLSLELLNSGVFRHIPPGDLEDSPVYQHIVDTMAGKKDFRYSMQVNFNHPIVGIGAPASYFLARAGQLLSAEIIVPDHADVANAVGAITSHIFLRQSLAIQPRSSGGYRVKGVAGNPRFSTLESAEQWAVSSLTERLREEAKRAGTSEESVNIDIDDRLFHLRDGSRQFLERKLTGYLKGPPDLLNVIN